MLTPWKESYDHPRQHIQKQSHYFANKGPSSQGYGFSKGHVWMWELEYKEIWAPKNWCFWTAVLEKTLESPLDCKEIQPVRSEDQPWDFFGRNDAKGLVAQRLKLLPAMRETWVWFLGREDPLEKEMATHSSILAWRIPWTEEPGGLQSTESRSVGHDWATSLSLKKWY